MARLLAMPGSLGLIALQDSPVGFLIGRQVACEAEIISVGVIPAARATGVGAALLTAYAQHLSMRPVTEIFLEVAVDNHPAIALYAAQGFCKVGLRPEYYAAPGKSGIKTDAILMRRRLPDADPASENGNATGD